MILILGIGIPMDHARSQVTWYPLEAYPKTLDTRTILGRTPWHQFPNPPGEMKMNDVKTVSNENGFHTFFKRGFWFVVFNSSWKCEVQMAVEFTTCHMGIWYTDVVLLPLPDDGQRWKAEKPCLSIKLHLAEGKHHASLPIKGRLRVFHALVWLA